MGRENSKTVRCTVSTDMYNRVGELVKATGATRPGNVLQIALGIGVKYLENATQAKPDLAMQEAVEYLSKRK